MYVTLSRFDVNEEDVHLDIALGCFEGLVLPALRKEPGYQGAVVLRAPDGKGMVVGLWACEASAREAEAHSYAEQMEKLEPLLDREAPRDEYSVVLIDHAVG